MQFTSMRTIFGRPATLALGRGGIFPIDDLRFTRVSSCGELPADLGAAVPPSVLPDGHKPSPLGRGSSFGRSWSGVTPRRKSRFYFRFQWNQHDYYCYFEYS